MLDPHAALRALTITLKALNAAELIFRFSTRATEQPRTRVILEVIRFGQTAHHWTLCDEGVGVGEDVQFWQLKATVLAEYATYSVKATTGREHHYLVQNSFYAKWLKFCISTTAGCFQSILSQ
eukprot:scaffold8880_cov22-Tisochrysis_lutea.AAC.2